MKNCFCAYVTCYDICIHHEITRYIEIMTGDVLYDHTPLYNI